MEGNTNRVGMLGWKLKDAGEEEDEPDEVSVFDKFSASSSPLQPAYS